VPFTDAVKGATVKVNLKGGTDVKIPAGEQPPVSMLPACNTTYLLAIYEECQVMVSARHAPHRGVKGPGILRSQFQATLQI